MSSNKAGETPFTNPMNLTCRPAGRSNAGPYEYCIVLNTHGDAAPLPDEGWMPLPGFDPDPADTYHASGGVGKADANNKQSDADASLTGRQIGVFYREVLSRR